MCNDCENLNLSKYCRKNSKSLSETHPHLLEEWDWEENNKIDIKPENITYGSVIKAKWICSVCKSSFSMAINNRTSSNQGCPFCVYRKVNETNSLKSRFSIIAEEWDYEENKDLLPEQVVCFSSKIYSWKCKICKKSWKTSISHRTKDNTGCPYCTGQKVCLENCLATLRPDIAEQWHLTLNKTLTPFDVTLYSNKKVWWYCFDCKMDYDQQICNKTLGNYGCPYCSGQRLCNWNCLATLSPNVAAQWHPTKNEGLTPFDVFPGSNKKVYWLCPDCKMDYDMVIANKTSSNNQGCPYCAGQKVCEWNCLATVYPEIAKYWNYARNGNLTPNDVNGGSHKEVWWYCFKCGEEFIAAVYNRVKCGCVKCKKCVKYYKEEEVRIIIEKLTGEQFLKVKNINWFRNKNTNRPYEPDGYCEKLNLMFEHQGEQHCFYCSGFHKNENDFFFQLQRDADKYRLCQENNCRIIYTYYNQTKVEIEQHIKEKLIELGINIISE